MIRIDRDDCTLCLKCCEVCPDYVLALDSSPHGDAVKARYPDQCCACGHCISICPTGAISHDLLPLEAFEKLPTLDISPEAVSNLLFSRRSIRHYKTKRVPEALIEQLLECAVHAGTGGNIQTEGFIVIQDHDFLRQLELLTVDVLWKAGLRFANGDGLIWRAMAKRFGPKLTHQYRSYHGIIKHRRENDEIAGMIFRNAPLVILAHGLKANNLAQTNCAIALRNIEILACSMGLGSCWLGLLLGAADRNPKKINQFLDLDGSRSVFGGLMLGYPAYHYKHKMPRMKRDVRRI